MASITITLADTPAGGISIRSDYQPAVGNPCSRAQAAALEILSRTRKEFGLPVASGTGSAVTVAPVKADGLDIDAVHRTRDNVVLMHLTGDVNALNTDVADRRFFVIDGEERRPGVDELAFKLAQENPIWSRERCMAEAKKRWIAPVTPMAAA